MEIISESHNLESKELLPQVLLRIFSICKNDENFLYKDSLNEIEEEIAKHRKKLKGQTQLYEKSIALKVDLKKRIDVIDEKNFDAKSKLLEELGSEI